MSNNILSRKFRYAYWNACQIIIGINVIVYILTTMFSITINGPFQLTANGFPISVSSIDLFHVLSLMPAFVNHGWVWQFVTYMFVHGSPSHLFFNMYALLMFGMTLERAIGSREFLLYYFVTGILGGVLSYVINMLCGWQMIAILGASGAVYALMFLVSVLYPYNRVLLFFVIPMKMPTAVLTFLAIELVSQVMGTSTGVAHLVHLSSVLVAWIYCVVRFRISPAKVYRAVLTGRR